MTKLISYLFLPRRTIIVVALSILATSAAPIFSFAEIKILGNPNAPQGGTFRLNLGAEPPTLNPITSQDVYASRVQAYIVEPLFAINIDTYEFEPHLAESMEISKDGTVYTVRLRPGLTFSDGKPITAADVKFSFDVYFDDEYNAVHYRSYLEGIDKVEVVDDLTVRFTVKEVYFKNIEIVSGLSVLPKHIYGDSKKGKKLNKSMVGSGPYMIDTYQKGKRITLKRNPKWWGKKFEHLKGQNNFDQISFRFIKEDQVALERLRKGELDFNSLTPEQYEKKTVGADWEKILTKRKVQNKSPKGYGFIGWNLLNPLFQSRATRQALSLLMNRKLMIEKFRFGMDEEATGPWYRDSIYASQKVKPLSFDPKKAAKLLKADGWSDSNKNGVLDKMINGKLQEFRFTLLGTNRDFEKYLTIYKEDLKDAGIDVELKFIEWNAFIKLMDEKKFEAITLGWSGGSVDLDPKQIWHSSSAAPGGSNFISYKNPEVDRLIDKARGQLDRKDRVKTLQKVYELIADDAPYLFLFNSKFELYGIRKNIGTPKDTFNYSIGRDYWWMQPEAK